MYVRFHSFKDAHVYSELTRFVNVGLFLDENIVRI